METNSPEWKRTVQNANFMLPTMHLFGVSLIVSVPRLLTHQPIMLPSSLFTALLMAFYGSAHAYDMLMASYAYTVRLCSPVTPSGEHWVHCLRIGPPLHYTRLDN